MSHTVKRIKQKTMFQVWLSQTKRHGVKVIVRHPHHYFVALCITSCMIVVGPHLLEAHIPHWLYAVLENLSTMEEE